MTKVKSSCQILVGLAIMLATLGGAQQANAQVAHPEVNQQPNPPIAIFSVNPPVIFLNEVAHITIRFLPTIDAAGYTSVEFNCEYDLDKIEAVQNLITGSDKNAEDFVFANNALVIHQGISSTNESNLTRGSGRFIVAIARLQETNASQNKAEVQTARSPTTVFTIDARSPTTTVISQLNGNAATASNRKPNDLMVCHVQFSRGDQQLHDGGSFSITARELTVNPFHRPLPSPTLTATPIISTTSTPTTLNGSVTGQVLASKPVTINLLDSENIIVASMRANSDGRFNLTAPAGAYKIVAKAEGFLDAQSTVIITGNGNILTKESFHLLAGDIDDNGIIDEWDAMTIGMGYNTLEPIIADLNNDLNIDVLDLEILAANYRKTGPIIWQ